MDKRKGAWGGTKGKAFQGEGTDVSHVPFYQ